MIEAILSMCILGAVCGILLSVASKVFYVYEDPRIAEVENFLAAANCGGCGFAGCSAAAVAIVTGKAPPSACIVAGPESAIAIAGVLGVDPGSAEPKISHNECEGGFRAADKFDYMGINSCRAMAVMYGGKRVCTIGCIGMGDCVKACKFDAIHIGPNGFPVVDETKCVGCGACETACPKDILHVRTMSDRLLHFNQEDDALAPCAQTCPAEIDIPKYISQIREGNYEGAVHTIRERNPLLLSCGRVCPHPCEDYCRRGIEDEPVSINQLKRFVADYEMNSGKRLPVSCAPDTGKKVAVVGGGPAGLSCAFFLRRLGHSVTIFDMMPELGGMIRYGIPEYRLPKQVLKWETDGILNLGIEARLNVKLGKDFTISSLREDGYDAIFLGVGAWKDYKLGAEGEDLGNCYTGIDFLTKFAAYQQEGKPVNQYPIGQKCVVIGGGNTAIDCVRTLVRLGAKEVSIVYRRTRAEMPANMVEIEAAEHEGVNFHFLAAPTRVIGDENGKVKQLEYLKMELGEPDASGRRRPVPVEGSETLMDIDMLVTAIGQGPDVSFVDQEKETADIKITRWNTIDGDAEVLQSSVPYIFAAGDAYTGASLVVEAIGGGRRAARAIHLFLKEEEVVPVPKSLRKKHIPESIFESVDGIEAKKRTPMPEMEVAERIKSFVEADLVISEASAAYESNRCLNCCRICYNKDTQAA
ncbi:MAG: RnfABCDGE type electron transport complex subunit B [Desulfobacterales bacterium]|nr:RnfABCDGE type electron transport complex subunit B [Desulfobacterales bacterium]